VKPTSVLAAAAAMFVSVLFVKYAAGATPSQQDPPGKVLYEANCRKCHGVRGVPPKTMKAKYEKIATFDADFFKKHTDDSVVTILTKGKGEDMKSFKAKLTHEQMEQVADYIKSFVKKD
jgi:mono/diheme cytochrome c family protein